MKIYPLADRILLKQAAAADETDGGIIIPEKAKGKADKAEVVAVGRGRVTAHGHLVEPELKPGDTVIFPAYAGYEFRDSETGEFHLLVKEDEIFGVIAEA